MLIAVIGDVDDEYINLYETERGLVNEQDLTDEEKNYYNKLEENQNDDSFLI